MRVGAHRRSAAIVWLVAGALAALVWLSAEGTITHQTLQARNAALEGAKLRARAAAADLERTLESTAGLHILAQARAILLERGDTAGAQAIQFQLEMLARHPVFGIAGMAVTNRDGQVTWTSNGLHPSVSLSDLGYFTRLRDTSATLVIGTLRRNLGFSDRSGIPVARELLGQHGAFAGVSVVGLDRAAVAKQIAQPDLRHHGAAVLLRGGDAEAASDTPAAVDSRVLAYGGPPGGPNHLRPGAPTPVLAEILAQARSMGEGQGAIVDPATGHMFLAGWSPVQPTRLLVAISLDSAAALSAVRREALIIRGIATTLTLLDIMGASGLLLLRARRRAAEALAEAQQAQSATEAARAELERLVASLPAMVYHGDLTADGSLTSRYITSNAAQVIGWPHDRLPPRDTFLAHIDPGLGKDVANFFAGLLKGGRDTLEYRMVRPDGSWVWLRHHARVVARNGDGGEVIGSLANITEERALRAQAAISSQLATLGEMAGGIAHELNRPLAVMVMAAHNALATLDEPEPDVEQVRVRLQRIGEQGMRANRIIHHLQALSRPENEPQEEVALASAVEGAMTLAGGTLRQAYVVVDDRIPGNLPPVLGQAVAIEQVLVNLFINARDAMTARPPDARRLCLTADYDDTTVTLDVADSGTGIPEAVMSRIFEPFFTTKGAGQGTGLGLSICHAAMREMGGSITARNTPDGATFRLVFRRIPSEP